MLYYYPCLQVDEAPETSSNCPKVSKHVLECGSMPELFIVINTVSFCDLLYNHYLLYNHLSYIITQSEIYSYCIFLFPFT